MVEVAIPLRPTVRVRGVVREKGTKRPIAGVELSINRRFGGDSMAVSDAEGNYSAVVVREVNQAFGWPIRIPRPFSEPEGHPRCPSGCPRGTGPNCCCRCSSWQRGVDLPGVVVDEAGKPAGGAEVESVSGQSILTRADRDGRFVLPGVDPLRELKLVARRGPASSGTPVTIRAGNLGSTPLKLTIRPGQTGRFGGRVVDPSGRPIAGASVRIWRQVRHESGVLFLKEPVAGEDGSIVVRTGADGRFRAGDRCRREMNTRPTPRPPGGSRRIPPR